MRHIFELFLLFIALTALPDWYIYRTYIRQWKKKAMRMLYWVPSIVLLLGMVYVFGSFKAKPESMNLLGIFLITFLTISVPKIVFTLLSLLFRAILPKSKGRFLGICIAGASALFVMGYILYGALFGTENFKVRETTILSKDLPQGFENYRIVQISDIHCGSWAGNPQALQKAVNIINAQQPDLIVNGTGSIFIDCKLSGSKK